MYKNTHKSRMTYKAVGLALSLVMLLSTYMTGSYAWSAIFNQENIFSGTQNPAYVAQLLKYERGTDGSDTEIPVPGTPFYLYKITDDVRVQIGGTYLTGADGKIEVTDIAAGHYIFVEITPVYGFAFDKDADGNDITEYPFSVNKDTPGGKITLAAYNPHILKELKITKHVKNEDEQKDILFEFTVTLSDDGLYSYTIDGVEQPDQMMSGGKFHLKDGQTAVIKGLPVGLLYTVRETPVEDYSVSSGSHRGNITPEGAIVEFINTYGLETEPNDTTLTVKKLVRGEGGDSDKEFRFTVYIDGSLQMFTLKHDQTKTIILPVGARYEVFEEDYSPEYSQSSLGSGYGNATPQAIEFTLINTYTGPVNIEINGEKTWDMNGCDNVQKPESVKVYLMNGETVVGITMVTPDASDKWLYSFTVPKYDADGNEIIYTVREETVPGYISQVDRYNLENTYIVPAYYEPGIKKTIKGDIPGQDAEFTFELTAVDDAPMPHSDTMIITGQGEVKFGEITFNSPGVYQYTLTELTGNTPGYFYDKAAYILIVKVEQSGSALLVKSVEYIKTATDEVCDSAEFINYYSRSKTTAATEPSGTSTAKTSEPTDTTTAVSNTSTTDSNTSTEVASTTEKSSIPPKTTTSVDGISSTTTAPYYIFTTNQNFTTAPSGGTSDGGSPGEPGYPDNKPVTGDTTSGMTLWLILMIVSAFGLRWTIHRLQESKVGVRQRW